MNKEQNKQDSKANEINPEFKMYQNESIVFKQKIDPVTGEIVKETTN